MATLDTLKRQAEQAEKALEQARVFAAEAKARLEEAESSTAMFKYSGDGDLFVDQDGIAYLYFSGRLWRISEDSRHGSPAYWVVDAGRKLVRAKRVGGYAINGAVDPLP